MLGVSVPVARIDHSFAERVVGMIPVRHSKAAVSSSEGRPMLSRRSTRTRHAIRCFMRDCASPPLARTYARTTCACASVSRPRSRPSSDDVPNIQGLDDQLHDEAELRNDTREKMARFEMVKRKSTEMMGVGKEQRDRGKVREDTENVEQRVTESHRNGAWRSWEVGDVNSREEGDRGKTSGGEERMVEDENKRLEERRK
jgi:hypothetical protein